MRQRGFTLLEVMIALGLILALLAVMFGFLSDVQGSRRRALAFTARQRAATTLIDHLERDLMTCVVEDDEGGAGVAGSERSLRILSRGVLIRSSGEPNAAWRDMQISDYEFREGKGIVNMRRMAVGEGSGARFYPLGGRVGQVRFRYHDGNRWIDSYNSADQGHLPRAVEVAIWFNSPDSHDSEMREEERLSDSGLQPERNTFDATAGFDEEAFALESDLKEFAEPSPDRIRVILIPDSEVEDEEGNEMFFAGDPEDEP